MAEVTVPASIRIFVPEDQFGDAYTTDGKRQWVERRQRLSRSLLKAVTALENIYSDEQAFEQACSLFAQIFTDWNLSSDDGPLAKPWLNPKAFEDLMESDVHLMLWVIGLIHTRISALLETDPN